MAGSARTIGGKVVRAVDTVTVLRFIKMLSTPFPKWPAYETGVIDENGDTVTPANERTPEQKASFTMFHKLARNIKRLVNKIPFGSTILGSFAAAMFLLREAHMNPFGRHLEERWQDFIENDQKFINEAYEVFESQQELQEQTTTAAVQGADFPLDVTYKPDKFMGMKVFDVDTQRYMKSKDGKKKYTKYSRYVGDDEIGEEIRQYGRQYPKSGIILRDSKSGSMIFLRKPQ